VPISRRSFLAAAAASAAAVVAACTSGRKHGTTTAATTTPSAPPTTEPPTTVPPTTTEPTGPARFVPNGDRTRKQVALTFHGSGDVGLTRQLLDHAAKASAPITVFAVGQWLQDNPTMAKEILAGGHELANHTFTHPALGSVDRAGVAREITQCRDLLQRQTGTGGLWFRPSGIDKPTTLMLNEAGAAGYATIVGYDVDPLDYEDPGAQLVTQRVTSGVKPGSIVSLHTGHAGTVTAFDGVVAAIRAKGLELVTVRTLLGTHP
jgi:peptidoglycan/xylan/chitin deacetylase (PgdA/CDA1 family)